jgi:hypothetical protein
MDKTAWIVKLSDGESFSSEEKTWQELKKYVENNFLSIVAMQLRFRDHIVPIPEKMDGYYFSNGIGIQLQGSAYDLFVTGTLIGNILYKVSFYVPELEIASQEKCSLESIDQEKIIYNHGKNPNTKK